MARFYATIQGSRGEASRMGTLASGMRGHVRGWNVGASVYMDTEGDDDVCYVQATTGSHGESYQAMGELRNVDGTLVFEPSAWVVEQVRLSARRQRATAKREARTTAKLAIAKKYRELRAQYPGIGARTALAWARTPEPPELDWDNHGEGMRATLKVKGYDVTIAARPDYDIEPMGKFTGSWQEGAIVIPESDRRDWRYYVPMTTYSEQRKGLRAMGYARHEADCLARKYVREDMARDLAGREGFWLLVIVSREGVELGTDSLGGIELGDDGSIEREAASAVRDHGMIDNAIDEASKALAKLAVSQ